MRKFNIRKKNNFQNRMYSEPTDVDYETNNSFVRYQPKKSIDTLEQFHTSLLKKSQILSNARIQVESMKNKRLTTTENEENRYRSVKRISDDVKYLKSEMERKNNYLQQRREQKLGRFIENLKDQMQRSIQPPPLQLPPVQPMMYPIPPNYSMVPNQFLQRDQFKRSRFRTTPQEEQSFYEPRNKIKSKVNKAERLKRNMRKWRKVANAVLFTIYLERFCQSMRHHRSLVFDTMKASLKVNLNTMKQDLYKMLKPFFSIIISKRDVELQVEEDEDKQINKEKITTIRKLVVMVLEVAKKWTQFAKQNRKFTQIIYLLCRHGNYSCTQPLLTEQELDLCCISSKFKYISADRNLQTASYINLLFIKIVIFNILLAPSKFSSEISGSTIEDNLEIISSIVYELVIDVQDDAMVKVPKSYKIGNYKQNKWVQKTKPLVYRNRSFENGELISGLKGEEWVKKHFKIQTWKQEKSMINSTLSIFHVMMLNYHQKLIDKLCKKRSSSPSSSLS